MRGLIFSPDQPICENLGVTGGWGFNDDHQPDFWLCVDNGERVVREDQVPATGTWKAMFRMRCASVACFAADVSAQAIGTFDPSRINGRPARPGVGYCLRCSRLLAAAGLFELRWEIGMGNG
jgi:hypothetical protein